jgi:hypothetical protein
VPLILSRRKILRAALAAPAIITGKAVAGKIAGIPAMKNAYILGDGSSTMQGIPVDASSYLSRYATLRPTVTLNNQAQTSDNFGDVAARLTTTNTNLTNATQPIKIFVGQLAGNNFEVGNEYDNNVSGWVTAVQSYLSSIKTANPSVIIILITLLSAPNDPDYLASWPTVCAATGAMVTEGYANYCLRADQDAVLGIPEFYASAALCLDGRHPTTLGYTYYLQDLAAIIDPLLYVA